MSPSVFYPLPGALGDSDMLFETGLLDTPFRNTGFGLFHAANATMVLLSSTQVRLRPPAALEAGTVDRRSVFQYCHLNNLADRSIQLTPAP
jgi:hypothetical protein